MAYTGDYEAFLRQRAERRLAQQRAFAKQARNLAAEEDFIRRNIAGNNSAQAKGRRRRLERVSRLSPPPGEEGAMALRLAADERGGDQVVAADDVSLAIGGRTLLSGFDARLMRGEVVGLVGPNGAGKSTLLRAIAGERAADAGEIRVPDSVRVAYYRQDLAQVPADETLYDIVAHLRPHWGRGPIQGHLGRFGFSGDSVQRRAATLSGGERARVALAMMMLSGANLLIFDEPTNHLDVESIEALEDAIEEYDGTVLLVSHDRALLRGAHHPGLGPPRGADHRLPRQLRGVGDGEPRTGPRGGRRGGGGGVAPQGQGAEADPAARRRAPATSDGPAPGGAVGDGGRAGRHRVGGAGRSAPSRTGGSSPLPDRGWGEAGRRPRPGHGGGPRPPGRRVRALGGRDAGSGVNRVDQAVLPASTCLQI